MGHVYYSAPGGGGDFEVVNILGDYSAPVPAGAGLGIYADVSAGSITVTLPQDAVGKIFMVKLLDPGATGNQVRVEVDLGGTIDNAANYTLTSDNQAILLQCDIISIYKIDADYSTTGGPVPTLQLVCVAGNQTGTGIIATQYQATGVANITTSGVHAASLGVSLYLIDLFAAGGNVTINLPTGASALGAIFSFQILAVSPATVYTVRINGTNGGFILLTQPFETAIVQCWDAVSIVPYKRINQGVRTIADLYALTVPAGVTFNIPHRMGSTPQSCNIQPANAAAQGVLAGGYHLSLTGTDIVVTLIAPVGAPVPACQFFFQAYTR